MLLTCIEVQWTSPIGHRHSNSFRDIANVDTEAYTDPKCICMFCTDGQWISISLLTSLEVFFMSMITHVIYVAIEGIIEELCVHDEREICEEFLNT